MRPFAPLENLLAHVEAGLCCLVQRARGIDQHHFARPQLTATDGASGWVTGSAGAWARRYMVRYQLTGAELREGRVVASYVAPCVRLFDTDELNVIWAELVDELGTSPYRLGLEILAIDTYSPPVRQASRSRSET
jgi:hypothetical protein